MKRKPPSPETLGARLREARQKFKWTQLDLEAASKVSQKTISDIETGKIVKPGEIAELADACQVRAIWLAKGIGPRDESAGGHPRGEADMIYLNDLGGRIADLRKELRISEPHLAAFAGLTVAELRALEQGRLWPGPVSLSRIALELQTSLDWLVSGWTVDVLVTGKEQHPLARVLHELPPGGYRRVT